MQGIRNVLIAEPDVNLCRVLDAELQRAGYSVTSVHTGGEAVREVSENRYAVVILDIGPPVIGGLAALRDIRKIAPDLPVIVTTAYSNNDMLTSALHSGANVCISKPFEFESLIAFVGASLGGQSLPLDTEDTSSSAAALFQKHQNVSIEVRDGDSVGDYCTRVEDKDDVTLTLACPSSDGRPIDIKLGSPISIGVSGDDALYSFDTAVLSKLGGDFPAVVVAKPAVIYRTQRRVHSRVRVSVPLEITVVKKQTGGDQVTESYHLRTEDVGVGGFKMAAPEEFPNGAEVHILALHIPDADPITGAGKVVYARRVVSERDAFWTYGVKFTRIDGSARQRLLDMARTAQDRSRTSSARE